MDINEIITSCLEECGGQQCKICNEWDDKHRFVGPVCGDCNDEIEEVLRTTSKNYVIQELNLQILYSKF